MFVKYYSYVVMVVIKDNGFKLSIFLLSRFHSLQALLIIDIHGGGGCYVFFDKDVCLGMQTPHTISGCRE